VLSIPELEIGKVTETKEAMPLLNKEGLVANPEDTKEKTV
jgi:hypothetical protein